MPAKFELKKAKNGQFHFNLLATNGEIILSSEIYTTKTSAKKGIASVQTNSGDESRYVRKQDRRKQHYFLLRSGNNRVIGRSESYSRPVAMEKGIKSVIKNGQTDKLADSTV